MSDTYKLFYVSMSWSNQASDGFYTTTIEAKDEEEAKNLCREKMAGYAAQTMNSTVEYVKNFYSSTWHLVDCFSINEFVASHYPPAGDNPDCDLKAAMHTLQLIKQEIALRTKETI